MRQFISSILSASFLAALSVSEESCWPEWSGLASDFETLFIEDETCSDAARAAIRLAFHDCFPGSCDGSIINANECTERVENTQMVRICGTLGEKADEYGLGTADVIQFAADAPAIGLASCSGGPVISFYSGRPDSFLPTPLGMMPNATTDARTMVDLFAQHNFSKTELVALTGAHTIGRQLDGTDMDNTPGEWDHKFYSETSSNSAPQPVAADTFLAQDGETGEEWRAVGKTQESFKDAFIPAMEKLSLMGSNKDHMTDCSGVVQSYAGRAKGRRRVLLKGKRLE
ncbi:heme peroxidase [Paraphaeosphaeria sporulosa]|uniref:Peroxidase n=1 Tax=Paraphaeosphaeria sporulosa TaxID=1460663 RepID=A0A177CSM5_9PLEO|nr:heme peroxidase [Paraphaeosphaeria sporulosa]OAG09942.1 heme peroxidase [Paraphaeosphaeria sporulosa]